MPQVIQAKHRRCPACDIQLLDEEERCPRCRRVVAGAVPARVERPRDLGPLRWLVPAMLVGVVAGAAFVAVYGLLHGWVAAAHLAARARGNESAVVLLMACVGAASGYPKGGEGGFLFGFSLPDFEFEPCIAAGLASGAFGGLLALAVHLGYPAAGMGATGAGEPDLTTGILFLVAATGACGGAAAKVVRWLA